MKITILSLFKEQFDSFVSTSIIKRAIENKLVEVEVVDYREFSTNKLKRVDETPYGGGAGMVISIEPILACLEKYRTKDSLVYLMSASGKLYSEQMAKDLSKKNHIILICGHYEGVDERLLDYIDGEICVGDYVLTGGEIPAMLVADSIIRLVDGVISHDSIVNESFENGLVEYGQYTVPRDYKGNKVPDIYFSGNHKAIEKYRFKEQVIKTKKNRPDLFEKKVFTKEELKLLKEDNIIDKAIEKAKKFM